MALAELYVDLDSGNDSDTGGSGDPFLTIQKALDEADFTTDGCDINVTGSATLTASLNDDSSGTTSGVGRPIRLRRWEGNTRPAITFDNVVMWDRSDIAGLILQELDLYWINLATDTYLTGLNNNGQHYRKIFFCNFFGDGPTSGTGNYNGIQGADYEVWIGNYIDGVDGYGMAPDGDSLVVGNYCVTSTNRGMTIAGNTNCGFNTVVILSESGSNTAGIRFEGNFTQIYNNIVIDEGSSTRGITTIAAENIQTYSDNYVEGFSENYELNNSHLVEFAGNVSSKAGSLDWDEFNGWTPDATNITTSESWLMKDSSGLYLPGPKLIQHWGQDPYPSTDKPTFKKLQYDSIKAYRNSKYSVNTAS